MLHDSRNSRFLIFTPTPIRLPKMGAKFDDDCSVKGVWHGAGFMRLSNPADVDALLANKAD